MLFELTDGQLSLFGDPDFTSRKRYRPTSEAAGRGDDDAEFVTIGAYGWVAERFFGALVAAGVDTFCDLRARRGVRGPDYTFANSQRLQARLAELGIRYMHCTDLAPERDDAGHASRRGRSHGHRKAPRTVLSPAFVAAYRRERLDGFDSAAFVADLGPEARVVALFCVEREPAACHRSLLADRLAHDLGARVRHLITQISGAFKISLDQPSGALTRGGAVPARSRSRS